MIRRNSYGLEGIKILGHPGEEDAQVKIIKAQILAAEEEHKALRKRLEELRLFHFGMHYIPLPSH